MAIDADGIIQAITADAQGRRRRVRGVPGGDGPDARCPGRTRSRARVRDGDGAGPTPWARPRTAGPWMFETTAREMAIDHAANEIGLDPAEFRRRNLLAAVRPAVHRADRQRVPGDHPARDARAGARDPRLRGVPQGAGRRARRGPATSGWASAAYVEPTSMGGNTLATEAATVQGRDQRAGRGLPRHHVARPEHRDHHGADRRRAPRRGVRRRHHRAGRLAVDALRARHRREPHRGRRRRRGAARRPSRCARRCSRSPRT